MSKRLILNGKVLPLPPDTELAITYQAHDVRKLGSRDGAYAETIELPDTNEVRAAVENSHLVTSATKTPYRLLPASLEYKQNAVLTGVAGHTEAGAGFTFEVNGLNADWFERIAGKNLQDIDLSDLDHAYTPANVAAANTHDPERGYVYPLANYGFWDFRYLDGTNQHFTELFPAVYVAELLKRMAAPYTLSGSLLTDARFRKMALAFTGGQMKYRAAYVEQFTGKAATNISRYYDRNPVRIKFQTFTGSGLWGSNSEYLTPQNGCYHVKATVNISVTASEGLVNTIELVYIDTTGTALILATQEVRNGENQTVTLEASTNLLNPGEQLYLAYDPILSDPNSTTNNTQILPGSTFEVSLENTVAPYGQVHLDANLPDMSQEDLVLTICNMFNVLIQTDPIRKIVRLDLLEDLRRRPVVDWSNKIDWSQRPRVAFALPDYAQRNVLGYEPLEYPDSFGNEQQDITEITVDNERLGREGELYISPFTSTQMRPAFRGNLLLPYIPMVTVKVSSFGLWRRWVKYSEVDYVYWGGNYWKGKDYSTNLMPGYYSDYWEIVPIDEVLEFSEATPRLIMVEPRGTGKSIPVGENAIGGTHTLLNTQAVFEKADGSGLNAEALRLSYYGITEAMLKDTRILTLRMRLKLPDINQLDFLRPVMLNVPTRNLEGLFYLNKVIQFNPEHAGSTEVELVRVYGLPLATTESAHLEYSEEYSEEYN